MPGTLLLWNTTLRRAEGPLIFGPQHEMGLGFRIATPLVAKGGSGRILECVSLYGDVADGASNGRCSVTYRAVDQREWQSAQELWFDANRGDAPDRGAHESGTQDLKYGSVVWQDMQSRVSAGHNGTGRWHNYLL